MGGVSREREVSLKTGMGIAAALARRNYQVTVIDVKRQLVQQLQQTPIDVAVIALHGVFGEDGMTQGLLEWLQIPYTGAGVMGSAIAMDKVVCKHVASDLGISVPAHALFRTNTDSPTKFVESLAMEFPVIVKPCREGSTIGLSVVERVEQMSEALLQAATSDDLVMVEDFVAGTEVTVGIVSGEVLPCLEIVPKNRLYDYEAKYTKGMTEYILPARIPDATAAIVQDWSIRLWRAINGRGTARADFIVRPDGSAVFLEINTIPGMTETSLIPKAAAYAGISYEDICERMLNEASLRLKMDV